MTYVRAASLKFVAATCGCILLGACGGGDDAAEPVDVPVTIVVTGPNAVSYWNEVATNTINVPASATGTPEEVAEMKQSHTGHYLKPLLIRDRA